MPAGSIVSDHVSPLALSNMMTNYWWYCTWVDNRIHVPLESYATEEYIRVMMGNLLLFRPRGQVVRDN